MRLIAFLALLTVASQANAACPGRFAHLAKFAGEQPSRLLEQREIATGLRDLMGEELARLRTNLSIGAPVALIGCEVVVQGNAPHQGGERGAIMSFDLYHGVMTIAMLDGDHINIRATRHGTRDPADYSHLPAHVQDWVYVASNGFRSRGSLPTSAVMHPVPKP